jgi:alkylation response protein AidB-like acyl-CoA dehydrogenase
MNKSPIDYDAMDISPPTIPLLERLQSLAPRLRATVEQSERRARLADDAVAALVENGLFRLWVPRRFGGLELDLPSTLEVYQAAAGIDGSIGWAVMIGCGGGLFAAKLEPDTAREIFAPAAAVIAGSGAPDGRALRVPGGYKVTGRWRYASGAHYATTFTANCLIDGGPLIRAMAFERSQVQIIESWDTSGMRGTGSHDFEVHEAFVPERRSFSVLTEAPYEQGPLYRVPFQVLTELPVLAVAIGIARHALQAFGEFGRASDTQVQATYAKAHAAWNIALASMRAQAQQSWTAACASVDLTACEAAQNTAACIQAIAGLKLALAELGSLAGMAALDRDNEFARATRDLVALSAHASVSPRGLAGAGATLLDSLCADSSTAAHANIH